MMDEYRELYQQIILDHNKNPRNFTTIDPSTHHAEGYNPLCGDHYTIFMNVEGDVIRKVGFQGNGCAISKASASVMTTLLKGKTIAEAEHLLELFHDVVMGKQELPSDDDDDPALDKIRAFVGVRDFPVRVKCATLPWHAAKAALHEADQVSTE
ncbi:MAG: SUF system NifU family Fe-S cluster assembly protein [Gemmatimonadetes bacterium]|nr:MAG: SUF system NifU family Fe-S cluster assembly protein [Gemmatimonadota bacterium]